VSKLYFTWEGLHQFLTLNENLQGQGADIPCNSSEASVCKRNLLCLEILGKFFFQNHNCDMIKILPMLK